MWLSGNDRPHMLQALFVLGVGKVVLSSLLGWGMDVILVRMSGGK